MGGEARRRAAQRDGALRATRRPGEEPSLRRAAAAGDRPRAGDRSEGAPFGRARRRNEPEGEGGADAAHPRDPRPLRRGDRAHRARHEARHERVRTDPGARPRRHHRPGAAARNPDQPARHRGVPGREVRARARRTDRRGKGAAVTEALLRLSELDVHYGAIHALRGITFEVREGEIVTLIGANGAGKTTTLRAISGLLRPSGGSISYRGEGAVGVKPHKLVEKGLSHAPEGRGIFPNLTVRENLLLGAFLRRDQDGIAKDMERGFALFPILREREHQMAGTLSGGEQQMLSIARALMAKPKLLLLDEPSLGLAPQVTETIFRIIEEINRAGVTILLVEQNAHLALGIAHHGHVLETGQVVQSGTGQELLRSPEVRKAYLGE